MLFPINQNREYACIVCSQQILIRIADIDCVFLDLARPWDGAIVAAEDALKPGGTLTVFVPNWSQVEKSVAAIEGGEFLLLEVFEVFRRDLKVDLSRSVMRPETRFAVAYTGVVITAVRLASETT